MDVRVANCGRGKEDPNVSVFLCRLPFLKRWRWAVGKRLELVIARGCSDGWVFGRPARGWKQGCSPALLVRRSRAVLCRLMAIISCEPEDGQIGQTGSVWLFAGGREIRISSLELAKLYSSRA